MNSFFTFLAIAWLALFVAGIVTAETLKRRGKIPSYNIRQESLYFTLLAFLWLAWRMLS